ncbi:MAG TPA: reverse transcriptase domain-containing protein [Methylomirabilota bacterium]|nr:reverse transcriptase domain-containing protein [Methylomirabilota bacterium]
MHKFRKGYRSVGLPQGGALSPLLSVLTLIVLDELKEKGINHVIYCDDGIFYSDEPIDFIEEAQSLLDKNGIGAYFSLPKSKWIKKDGE